MRNEILAGLCPDDRKDVQAGLFGPTVLRAIANYLEESGEYFTAAELMFFFGSLTQK